MEKFQAQIYKINDILSWSTRKELMLSPKFQRRTVWSPRGKSYLMDSIVKGFPLPPFFIREKLILKEKRTVREVVDGQQRLRTILEYIADGFTIMPIHNSEYSRIKFSQLPESVQENILTFPLSINTLIGTDDSSVLDIFSRLNAYSVPLNEQEKLNALYVGVFKQKMDYLSKLHLVFWEENKIVTKTQVARMKEVEFTSELISAMLEGLLNGKSIIKFNYKKYDDEFSQFSYLEERFSSTLENCKIILDNNICESEFKRMPLFFSLFGAAYDLQYGFKSDDTITIKHFDQTNIEAVQQTLYQLSQIIAGQESGEENTIEMTAEFSQFLTSTKSSTDKITNRTTRHTILKEILTPLFV